MKDKMSNAQLDITVLEEANHFLIRNEVTKVNEAITKVIEYAKACQQVDPC